MNESKFTWIDRIILVIAIGLIVANLFLLIFASELMNTLSSFLFQLLTLILSVYIAFRITTISVMNKTIELQKNTAKTAMRHIRGYQWSIEALIDIIKNKISNSADDKFKDSLAEVNHHLANLSMGISLSETDFKDILGEEFKEERLVITKLNNDIELLTKKVNEVKKLSKEKEQANKERIDALNNEIRVLRSQISSDIYKLPISGPYLQDREYLPLSIKTQDIITPLSHAGISLGQNLRYEPEKFIDSSIKEKEEKNKNTEKTVKTKKRKTQKK